MNRKGFTLVELVAIIVILAAIFLVSFPTLKNMLANDDKKKYNTIVEDLCTAGKTYMYANMDSFPNLSIIGGTIDLEISKLIEYGNVDKNLINPKTELSVKYDKLKYTVLEDFSLDCEYVE